MSLIKKNFNSIIILIIIFFSFLVNLYYSNIGSFPIDTFLHYDSSSRILDGEIPIRDFWIVSGFIIDFIQSLFFKLLGVNWNAYVFHSSLFNSLISLIIYYYFLNLDISKTISLFLTCCFSILAYTISGTPFVDHHAIFFLLISTILMIKVINIEKNNLWIFIILFFFLSFFTKQVPATYIIFTQGIIVSFYIFYEKKYIIINYIALTCFFLILTFVSFLLYLNIDLKSFYIQYFDYPKSIGSSRLTNFEITLNSFFNNYKFILLPLILNLILIIKRNWKQVDKSLKKEIYTFSIMLCFVFGSIFHQLMTKNQIYIYFLVPILWGALLAEIKLTNHKHKLLFSSLLILSIFFITLKYHYRYNESRKFHELENVDLTKAIEANILNKNLNGLNWINPFYKGSPKDEIILINEGIKNIENEKKEIILFTHYLFLESVTNKKLNYPARTFTMDGASIPVMGTKYFEYYRSFFANLIKSKNIEKIYFFKHEGISLKNVTDYIKSDCYISSENNIFYIFDLKCNQ